MVIDLVGVPKGKGCRTEIRRSHAPSIRVQRGFLPDRSGFVAVVLQMRGWYRWGHPTTPNQRELLPHSCGRIRVRRLSRSVAPSSETIDLHQAAGRDTRRRFAQILHLVGEELQAGPPGLYQIIGKVSAVLIPDFMQTIKLWRAIVAESLFKFSHFQNLHNCIVILNGRCLECRHKQI